MTGSLRTIISLKCQLAQLQLWTPQEIQRIISDIQFQTLTAAARLKDLVNLYKGKKGVRVGVDPVRH